jgi:hypothetical protein
LEWLLQNDPPPEHFENVDNDNIEDATHEDQVLSSTTLYAERVLQTQLDIETTIVTPTKLLSAASEVRGITVLNQCERKVYIR